MQLKTRKPTAAVPWPCILVEGGEKSGKSWAAAQLSTSEKVGDVYWIDLGEGAADEYGAIPGARYEVVEHDGSWGEILFSVIEVRKLAEKAAANGDKPVVLVIDSMTAEWELLKDWAGQRARSSRKNQEILAKDPNADIPTSMNLWNDATARHRKLMTQLLTFPGIVILTARGKEVAKLDDRGQPIPHAKDYTIEGHKTLAYDATAVIRMSRDTHPMVISARSVHAGIRPGERPQPIPDFTLERVIFDILKCDPTGAHTRDLKDLSGADSALDTAKRAVWDAAKAKGMSGEDLALDYAQTTNKQLATATIDELNEYATLLRGPAPEAGK